MTVSGTLSASGVLLVVLLAARRGRLADGPDIQVEVTGFPALALVACSSASPA